MVLFLGYGMTEVGVTHANGKEDFRYKSVGRRLPLVEMKVCELIFSYIFYFQTFFFLKY
jgi:long-subunit acyl-CoA synthetase (AMP-forming)